MDTLHRLFSGQSLGGKRWWLVVGAIVIVTGLTRPLLFKPSGPRAAASPTPTPATAPAAPAAQTQPAETTPPEPAGKIPSLLDLERKTPPLISPTDSPAAGMFWRMLGSLAVVIALIAVGWFVFRRHLGGRMGALGRRQVTLLESARVGSRQNVLLVQAGSRKFLLAATPERITLVADVTEACPTHEQPHA
ncbi:MAG: flagellar biosynthetic protein FliO [Planctomycetota bacterium]|nr:flagellar biosynthetic protein FliO [Planctomycetota bacterium]